MKDSNININMGGKGANRTIASKHGRGENWKNFLTMLLLKSVVCL